MKNQTESFYIMFKEEKGDVSYLNKGFDKILLNFVGIKTICLKCCSSFLLKPKLHKYVKAGYVEKVSFSSSAQPSLSIPIIMSKAIHQFLGSSFAFRSWTYATTSITLTPEHLPLNSNLDSTVCYDTGCGVTLVNQDQLLKHLLQEKNQHYIHFVESQGYRRFQAQVRHICSLIIIFSEQK